MTPTYIMPPKPTCKVVKREGQRGARIDPKGCKVRTTKDAQGNKKKENKQGNEKIKRTTTNRDMRLAVVGSPQRHLIANWMLCIVRTVCTYSTAVLYRYS